MSSSYPIIGQGYIPQFDESPNYDGFEGSVKTRFVRMSASGCAEFIVREVTVYDDRGYQVCRSYRNQPTATVEEAALDCVHLLDSQPRPLTISYARRTYRPARLVSFLPTRSLRETAALTRLAADERRATADARVCIGEAPPTPLLSATGGGVPDVRSDVRRDE